MEAENSSLVSQAGEGSPAPTEMNDLQSLVSLYSNYIWNRVLSFLPNSNSNFLTKISNIYRTTVRLTSRRRKRICLPLPLPSASSLDPSPVRTSGSRMIFNALEDVVERIFINLHYIQKNLQFWQSRAEGSNAQKAYFMVCERGPNAFVNGIFQLLRDYVAEGSGMQHLYFSASSHMSERVTFLTNLRCFLATFLAQVYMEIDRVGENLAKDPQKSVPSLLVNISDLFLKLEASIGHFHAMHQSGSSVDGSYSVPLMFEKLPEINQEDSQWTDCETRDAINLIYQNLHKLESYISTVVSKHRRPRKVTLYWMRYTCGVVGISICSVWLLRHSRLMGSSDIDNWIHEAKESTVSFWKDHVEQPLLSIRDELFETFRKRHKGVMEKEEVQLTADSLHRMLLTFSEQTKGQKFPDNASDQEMLEIVMARYEKELMHPIQNLVGGELARALLIQVQKLKLDIETAMLELDQILRANEINFAILAALPAFVLSLILLMVVRAWFKQDTRAEGRGRAARIQRRLLMVEIERGIMQIQKCKDQGLHSRDGDKERGSSRSREKEREKGRDRDQERDRDRDRERSKERDRGERDRGDRERYRDRDRERHHRDRHHDRDRSERRERTRDRDENDYHRSRDYDRRREYDKDKEDRHRHRSRSREGRPEHRSRSRSRSRSKSKRISGFDMAPPASSLMPGATTVPVQVPGATPAMPGMFPNMFPLTPGQFGALPVMPVQAMTQQATRHARRVYVGGLPPTANEQSVATFFSYVMSAIGGNTAGPGDAVVNVYINHEKKFAFVEMRSVEEASNAMALDGIIFEGAPVKVRRPSDYNPSLAATLGPSQPNPNLNLGAVGLTPGSAGGLEGPDRIFVGGLPYYFTEAQIRELLESFGPLRGFDLVKDRETGNSKGYAFCVYQDLSVTDIACAALNGIKMGDKTLTVRRANQDASQPKPEQESVLLHAQQQIALQKLMFQPSPLATKVLCLTQVVSPDELKDDDDYGDILEDMRAECGKFGNLVNVVIPRPGPDVEHGPGVGKVFLEYADVDSSTKARQGLHGRKFGGNQVVAVFYPENKFSQGDYEGT